MIFKQNILRAMAIPVELTPNIRLGQLIANLAVIARGPSPEPVWDIEDDTLMEAVKTTLRITNGATEKSLDSEVIDRFLRI